LQEYLVPDTEEYTVGAYKSPRKGFVGQIVLRRELAAGLTYLEACRVCAAPAPTAKGCVGCQQDHGMEQEPALVAGLMTTSPGRGPRRPRPAFVSVAEIQ
jgi:hypothetical protein